MFSRSNTLAMIGAVAAVLVAWLTVVQVNEYGMDETPWMLAILVVFGLLGFSIVIGWKKRPISTGPPVRHFNNFTGLVDALNGELQQQLPDELAKFGPLTRATGTGAMFDALYRISAAELAFAALSLTGYRNDREYFSSDRYKRLQEAFLSEISRHVVFSKDGSSLSNEANPEEKHYKSLGDSEKLVSEAVLAMAEKEKHPLYVVFRSCNLGFIHKDSSPDEYEKFFGPIFRSIVRDSEQNLAYLI